MKNKHTFALTLMATLLVGACGQQASVDKSKTSTEATKPTATAPAAPAVAVRESLIKPINEPVVKDAAKVELGKKLYFDTRLSVTVTI